LCADRGKRGLLYVGDSLKDLALPIRKVMCNAKGRHISARQEPNTHRSSNLQELRLRVAGPEAQFNNLLSALPYLEPKKVELYLNDFDKVESENSETGLLFTQDDEREFKTRVCSNWLEARGFKTRLMERPFGCDFRCRPTEPRLAFCGFDSNPARRLLPKADFAHVMESGLGGTRHNFDTIRLHTLPNPRPAEELWPDPSPEEQERQAQEHERTARENPAYAELAEDICGRAELAGKSVAVPFVGVTAATLVVAEALRMLHDGPSHSDIKLSLSEPGRRWLPS